MLAASLHAGQSSQPQRAGIGYVYPAGGQQGKTFQVTLGGQYLEGVNAVFVSGDGVQAKVLELKVLPYSQELLLREQRDELKAMKSKKPEIKQQLSAVEKKMNTKQRNPACVAIGQQVVVEVTIAPDARPGEREIRLAAQRGLSNPLSFHVGHLPEYSAPPAVVSPKQILGREEESLRTRKLHDEVNVKLPCMVNGQISSGAVDRYRFYARKGQKLVFSAMARQLVPYIADAVPGWFQAVLKLTDGKGEQVAFTDDYKFRPDPVIFYEVQQDGEYSLAIYDSIYRGREDFVYRITMGEVPFVTSIFPLGGPAGGKTEVELKGWNLPVPTVTMDLRDRPQGVCPLQAPANARLTNVVPFAVDALPECLENEPNDKPADAQKVELPVIINGRINRPDDWDVFQFQGHANETVVAEAYARRLDSPLDAVLKLTDAAGNQLAFNDDHEDKSSGLNTHDADSYLTATLPADGLYFIHIGDTAHKGGGDHAYRLRLSTPQPDFALRVVPASVGITRRGTLPLTVFAFRKDGFSGSIKLELKDPPKGFTLAPVVLSEKDESVQLSLKADVKETPVPVRLHLVGSATVGGKEHVREAVPAEDRMQAFIYRHLVPAAEWQAFVYSPPVQPPLPPKIAAAAQAAAAAAKKKAPAPGTDAAKSTATAPKRLTRDQIIRTYRDLNELLSEGVITKAFYDRKIAEMEDSATPDSPMVADVSTPKTTPSTKTAAPEKKAPPLPKTGPTVKKVFVLANGQTIRAVMITNSETSYVLKDVNMKIHEVAKDSVVRIQDP